MHAIDTSRIIEEKRRPIKSGRKLRKINSHILQEDLEILEILETLKEDLTYIHACLDEITEPLLIDSYIFEVQAINKKYQFYLQLCKARGLAADIAIY
ncbi:MAG: YaaL family protein [Defluviitaleaceae bacterium]|nr:YaaL family protein [Defluviitaleaceae bacterium]